MSSIIKRIGFGSLSKLNIEWLKKQTPIDIVSPFHHLVDDKPVPYIEKLYAFKNSQQFEADLDYFLRNFHPYTLEEIIQKIQSGRPFEKKGFLICFDDGLRQVYETAAPILLRKGVPAALFINSAFVDNKDVFYNFKKGLILDKLDSQSIPDSLRKQAGLVLGQQPETQADLRKAIRSVNYLKKELMDQLGPLFGLDFDQFRREQRPFMTTAEINDLISKGFTVGSHSIDHPLYALIPLEEQLRQTRESTDYVTNTFGLPYKAFAFPHVDTGVGNAFFREMLDTANPAPGKAPLDIIFGNSTGMLERSPGVIHRFIGENPTIPIDHMVKSVLAYSALRQRIGKQFVERN